MIHLFEEAWVAQRVIVVAGEQPAEESTPPFAEVTANLVAELAEAAGPPP